MPAENTRPHGAEAGSDAPEALESASALAQGLPAVSPDLIEEIFADEIDNIVPTHGYHQMPVVALGGSAGSIQALRTFFQALPADSGMAYVVIIHLSPDHASTLPELLQAATAMPVRAAQDAERLEENHVYVIPPGKHLLVVNGHLRLTEPPRSSSARGRRTSCGSGAPPAPPARRRTPWPCCSSNTRAGSNTLRPSRSSPATWTRTPSARRARACTRFPSPPT